MEAEKPAGKRQRTKHDAAFRTEAVRRVNQDGQVVTRVTQALGVSEFMLEDIYDEASSHIVHLSQFFI